MSLSYECYSFFVVALVVQQHLSAEGTDVRTACSSSEFYTIRTIWHHTDHSDSVPRLQLRLHRVSFSLHARHDARLEESHDRTTNSRKLKSRTVRLRCTPSTIVHDVCHVYTAPKWHHTPHTEPERRAAHTLYYDNSLSRLMMLQSSARAL